MPSLKTSLTTLIALIAFAANSVLCRLALGEQLIDAASFTVIRLLSGLLVLLIILKVKRTKNSKLLKPNWKSASMLFLYAVSFSYAYIILETGTGALILFGSVQITMIIGAIYSGEKMRSLEWLGLAIAFLGFVYLVFPTINTPSITGFILMSVAGVGWGIYTLAGRNAQSPMIHTANNFLFAVPFVLVLACVAWFNNPLLTSQGVWLAVLSGVFASGIGYSIWYVALRGLSVMQAAVSQLSVPIIAAIGGIIFTFEIISLRFVIASIVILGGIFLVIIASHLSKNKTPA